MKPFHYHEPATIAEACRILKEHGKNARILAGGTDLVIQMKRGKISPAHVVNIKKISELNTITTNGEGIAIGAAVPLSAIVKHKDIAEKLPMVSKAAHSVGSVQVRNRAT
ncbi:FAD binding domain-containing protein, partial [Desulforhopalus singaporensis]